LIVGLNFRKKAILFLEMEKRKTNQSNV